MQYKFCPNCGKELPVQNAKFCPECGWDLSSAQVEKNYDVTCPECHSSIEREDEPCPNCGCPANLFIKTSKEEESSDSIYCCPDCGAQFASGSKPSVCPNCGCPSSKFTQIQPTQENSTGHRGWVVFFVILFAGLGIWYFCRTNSSSSTSDYTYSSSSSSYQSSSSSTLSASDKASMREISSHSWKRITAGDPYRECLLEVVSFSSDGSGYCQEIRYAGGNKISGSGFHFSYYINGDKVYCEGSWEYTFRRGKLYDRQNNQYKNGSSLMY